MPAGTAGGTGAAASTPAAAGEGEGSEDLAEALEDLLIATDPSTIAGSQLPGDLADAIEGERQAFAALWNGWAGEQLLAAARDVHAAALDLEAGLDTGAAGRAHRRHRGHGDRRTVTR